MAVANRYIRDLDGDIYSISQDRFSYYIELISKNGFLDLEEDYRSGVDHLDYKDQFYVINLYQGTKSFKRVWCIGDYNLCPDAMKDIIEMVEVDIKKNFIIK